MGRIRRHPVISGVIGLVVVVGAVLELTFFEFHKHFIDDKVNEAAPTFVQAAAPTSTAPPAAAPNGAPVTSSATAPTAPAPPQPEGMFVSRTHGTSGVARVLSDGRQRVLRFEDLKTDNGPDLHVYLVAGVDQQSPAGSYDDDFVSLGTLKGNVGNQNYDVPAEIDLKRYKTVVIWCKRFAVAFGAADLL